MARPDCSAKAVLLAIASAFFVSVSAAMGKYLLHDYHFIEIAWFKNITFFLPMLLFKWLGLWGNTLRVLPSAQQATQAVLPLLGSVLTLIALQYLPLVEVTAITFIAPIFTTALAAIFLGERPRCGDWIAVALGFVGVAIILRPQGSTQLAVIFPLATGLSIALSAILARRLSVNVDPIGILFYTGLIGAFATSPFLFAVWQTPSLGGFAVMLSMAIAFALSQYCGFFALALAEASALAPFVYVRVIAAGVIGILAFDEYPDLSAGLGALIVVAAGLYTVLTRSARRRRSV